MKQEKINQILARITNNIHNHTLSRTKQLQCFGFGQFASWQSTKYKTVTDFMRHITNTYKIVEFECVREEYLEYLQQCYDTIANKKPGYTKLIKSMCWSIYGYHARKGWENV